MSYTLRDLPLPVKVVASVFLMAVGLGYTSAMVQLHMQDSKSGKPMPTVEDVILKYTGKKKRDPNAPAAAPVSRLESLVMSPTLAISGQSMSAAFTTDDRAKGDLKFANATKGQPPAVVEEVKAQRKGEQVAFKLWINAPEADRKAAYIADKFVPPAGQMPAAFTAAFKDGDAVKIKSLIDNRCATCHSKGGEKEDPALDTYDGLAKFMTVDATPATGDWVKVEEPISITKLTQSTHAHLLSFAVLFSLTGLCFAMSSYPTSLRCILGPWVVIAVTADVSLWWLARLSEQWGPYFAMGIIATGGLAGLGLSAQIVLSLFNMYGPKGKVVVAALFLLGGAVGGLVGLNTIKPALDAKAVPVAKDEKKDEVKAPKDIGKASGPEVKKDDPKPKQYRPIHDFDRLLTLPALDANGNLLPREEIQFNGSEKGSMVAAFFEKDKAYKAIVDDPTTAQEVKDKLRAEREAELDALVAWGRAPEAKRAAAYSGNGFEVPPALAGKVNSMFVTDGKVKVRSLIDARCATCHAPEKKQEEFPLDTYAGVEKYLVPFAPPEPSAPPAPPAPKPVDPIPAAKD